MSHLRQHSFTGNTDHNFTGLLSGQLIQFDGTNIISAGVMPTSGDLWSASTGTNSIIANNGQGNVASGIYSFVSGFANLASGSTSSAIGKDNVAGGDYSHASGVDSKALSTNAFVHGDTNTVTGLNSVAIGGFNLTNNIDNSVLVPHLTVDGNFSGGTGGSVIYSAGTDLYDIFVAAGGGIGKYAADSAFTQSTALQINHNLGSEDVIVQLKNTSGELVIPDTVDNYQANSVDITVLTTATYKVIIIG